MLSKQNEELPVFPAGKRRLLLIRSVLGATNLMTHFYSLQVRYAMCKKTLFEVVFEFFKLAVRLPDQKLLNKIIF